MHNIGQFNNKLVIVICISRALPQLLQIRVSLGRGGDTRLKLLASCTCASIAQEYMASCRGLKHEYNVELSGVELDNSILTVDDDDVPGIAHQTSWTCGPNSVECMKNI